MTTCGGHTPVRYPAWQREYEAAILEVDPAKLKELITSAHAAIQERLESITAERCSSERDAIANALMFLRLLACPGKQDKVSSSGPRYLEKNEAAIQSATGLSGGSQR